MVWMCAIHLAHTEQRRAYTCISVSKLNAATRREREKERESLASVLHASSSFRFFFISEVVIASDILVNVVLRVLRSRSNEVLKAISFSIEVRLIEALRYWYIPSNVVELRD